MTFFGLLVGADCGVMISMSIVCAPVRQVLEEIMTFNFYSEELLSSKVSPRSIDDQGNQIVVLEVTSEA